MLKSQELYGNLGVCHGLPTCFQRLLMGDSSSPGAVRKVIMSGSLGMAECVLSRPWEPPEGWDRSCKWLLLQGEQGKWRPTLE